MYMKKKKKLNSNSFISKQLVVLTQKDMFVLIFSDM